MSDDIDAYRQPKPRFDPTINYGHILTAVSFIVAGAGAYYGMRAELQNVVQRVARIESTLQQIADWSGMIITAYVGGRSIEKVARIFARRS